MALARELGLDVIVLDHHLCEERPPVQALVTGLAGHPAITGAAIFDAADSPLAASGRVDQPGAHAVSADITVDEGVAGYARVGLATRPYWRGLEDPIVLIAALACAGLAYTVALVLLPIRVQEPTEPAPESPATKPARSAGRWRR